MATIALRAPLRTLCTGAAAVVAAAACLASTAPASGGLVEVGYSTPAALTKAARRARASVVRVVPALRIALVEGDAGTTRLARELRRSRGISFASKPAARQTAGEPGLTLGVVSTPFGGALAWQYYATAMDRVPADVRAAAVHVKIAVVDTGADLTAPDLVGKVAGTYDVQTGKNTVTDTDGHGTFVASLAAGSDTNGSGMAGFGGNARLLVVKAAASATFNDVDVAAG
ncbi:MAG TPA: S8 family serine peptidase, partial [Gaiellaceae bacterium]|nr:S8 family serine peptidase [Gaiellaceae bacterium]